MSSLKVFVAKKILTMDRSLPEATAVAVKDGKIVSVGTLDDVRLWFRGAKCEIDQTFANKVLLPGFIEPHGHPIIGGTALTRPLLTYMPSPNPYGDDFPGVKTRAEALAALKNYVLNSEPDRVLIAWGYDLTAMGGEHLDKTCLDEITCDRPLIVWEASEHFAYANSAALKKYKIAEADLQTVGVMSGPDRKPNGQFLGTSAAEKLMREPLNELMQPGSLDASIKYLMDLSRMNGVTTTSEMAMGVIDIDSEISALNRHFNNADSPLRLVVVSDAESALRAHGEQAISFVKKLSDSNSEKIIFNGVKFFADDAFLSLGMAIENPGYIDGRQGIFITEPEDMVEEWLPWWQAGFHIHVHTNGNAGNQATVNALDGLMKKFPRADHRFTFEHFGISTPEQARRVKSLGGVVSINPYYLHYRSELTAPYIGADRAYSAARLKTLLDEGVVVSLHTDTPVAPPRPLEEVWIAVNRFGLSGVVRGPAERISLEKAMRMITIDAAYTLGVEDKIGTISAGKFADFAVLEEDPFEVSPDHIRDVGVFATVSGGSVHLTSQISR